MEKIFTYLLGAGASYNNMPLIADFYDRLVGYKQELANYKFNTQRADTEFGERSITQLQKVITKEIDWLIKRIAEHKSIDTYARKLYLWKNKKDYRRLKLVVSEFLLHLQFNNGLNLRYDAFFASVLELTEDKISIPENLRILNWNYDRQVEYSLAQFFQENKGAEIEDIIQLFPRNDHTSKSLEDRFSIFKLNGTIGGLIDSTSFKTLSFNYNIDKNELTENQLEEVLVNSLKRYWNHLMKFNESNKHKYPEIKEHSIGYSWENNSTVNDVRSKALKATVETSELVVIGYSFPTFNRKLDGEILNNMSQLETIYVQAPPESIKGVTQRINALLNREINIEPIESVEEFYIPFGFK